MRAIASLHEQLREVKAQVTTVHAAQNIPQPQGQEPQALASKVSTLNTHLKNYYTSVNATLTEHRNFITSSLQANAKLMTMIADLPSKLQGVSSSRAPGSYPQLEPMLTKIHD